MLAGIYKFRVSNAIEYTPVSEVSGDYSITSKETGRWRSDRNGEVFLDHLKVGLTNIVFKNDPDYYNFVISGAKVKKGEESKQAPNGRSAMLVPRTLKDDLVFTMTWVGSDFQLNLIAETFIDSEAGRRDGENCVLSFAQPQCIGMEHRMSRDVNVKSDTVRVNSRLFYDSDKKLIAHKRVLLYVTDTKDKKEKEISYSNALIGITMPEQGQVAEIPVPFKTAEEEANTAGIIPNNWAALCLWVEPGVDGKQDVLRMKRLNGLATSKPNAVQLCGKDADAQQ